MSVRPDLTFPEPPRLKSLLKFAKKAYKSRMHPYDVRIKVEKELHAKYSANEAYAMLAHVIADRAWDD